MAAVLACILACGCSMVKKDTPPETRLVIPDYNTVAEQYEFAATFAKKLPPSVHKETRARQLRQQIQAYEKVVQSYPADTQFTPVAYLEIGDCYGSMGDYTRAREYYQAAPQRWPDNEFVRARSMYSYAKVLDAERNYTESKQVYKQVMDEFGKSGDSRIKQIVQRASAAYYTLREQPAAPGKKK
jgi:tetratricopeptide (TPR) repeat protein